MHVVFGDSCDILRTSDSVISFTDRDHSASVLCIEPGKGFGERGASPHGFFEDPADFQPAAAGSIASRDTRDEVRVRLP